MGKPDPQLARLTEKGFSKSKAEKALKLCKNNFSQALKYLESQSADAERVAKEEERRRAPPQPAEKALTEEKKAPRVRLHPCLVQYGNCRYGAGCAFKLLPGNVCINYILGNCIYGSSCRNVHVVDGFDLRQPIKDIMDTPIVMTDSRGRQYEVPRNPTGKVVAATSVEEEWDAGEVWLEGPLPQPCDFDPTQGAEPSYTEPLQAEVEEPMPAPIEYPTPFLDKVRAVAGAQAPVQRKQVVKAPARGDVAEPEYPTEVHPCVHQFGHCMFGDSCNFADLPADICVFYLNDRCHFSAKECRFRHERPQERPRPTDPDDCVESKPVDNTKRGVQVDEEDAFLSLVSMFPFKEPSDILHTLRLCCGQISTAAELLLSFEGPVTDAVFPPSEEPPNDGFARTEMLLTLSMLFPQIDTDSLEQVLERFSWKFEDAFASLEAESAGLGKPQIERRVLTAADKMKLERLSAVFPELPSTLIEDTYFSVGARLDDAQKAMQAFVRDIGTLSEEERKAIDQNMSRKELPLQTAGSTRSFQVTDEPSQPHAFISDGSLYKRTLKEIDGSEDPQRLRHEAEMLTHAYRQCFTLAAQSFRANKGKSAKELSIHGHQLKAKAERLHMLAMHALEATKKGCPTTLDLHGFRPEEALDVLKRRIESCRRSNVHTMRIVMGCGQHSRKGVAVLYPLIMDALRSEFATSVEIVSVRQAFVDVRIQK